MHAYTRIPNPPTKKVAWSAVMELKKKKLARISVERPKLLGYMASGWLDS